MSEYFFFKIYQNSIFCELYFMCLVHTGFIIGLCHGRDRMVVGLYNHLSCEFESCSGKVYSIQHYVIKFVSDLLQVGCFLRVLLFPPPIELTATL